MNETKTIVYDLPSGRRVIIVNGVCMDKEEVETERTCNKCMYNKIKPLSAFDGEMRTCKQCLLRGREKFECECGGRYTRSGISHQENKKASRMGDGTTVLNKNSCRMFI